jgi:hypothetical protein
MPIKEKIGFSKNLAKSYIVVSDFWPKAMIADGGVSDQFFCGRNYSLIIPF